MLTISGIKRSRTFGKTELNGTPIEENSRDIISLSFSDAGADRLAAAALDSEPYVTSVHVRRLYPDLRTSTGAYDYEAAFTAFEKEFAIGSKQEAFNGYEFPIKDLCAFKAVKVVLNGRIMKTRRIATAKDRANALEVAKRDLERGLAKNRYQGVEE